MEVAPHYTLFSLLTLLTLFTTTSVSPRRCIDVFWIYTGAMKVKEADNTQRPKGLCRALEGCLTGFLGGLRDVWEKLGLYWGLQAQMNGRTPKMNQHQMLLGFTKIGLNLKLPCGGICLTQNSKFFLHQAYMLELYQY